MRNLETTEIENVSGANATGGIVMGIAGAHASGVVGLGVGAVIGGPAARSPAMQQGWSSAA